jgi:hypothetical protein
MLPHLMAGPPRRSAYRAIHSREELGLGLAALSVVRVALLAAAGLGAD